MIEAVAHVTHTTPTIVWWCVVVFFSALFYRIGCIVTLVRVKRVITSITIQTLKGAEVLETAADALNALGLMSDLTTHERLRKLGETSTRMIQ